MSNDQKQCPFCAEYIKRDAVKCRFCGSNLDSSSDNRPFRSNDEIHWVRPINGRVLGGVCAGIAEELNAPQLALLFRLFFLFAVLFWGSGLGLYLILWLLMPSGDIKSASTAHTATSSPYQTPAKQPARYSPLAALVIAILALIGAAALISILGNIWGHHFNFPSFHFTPFALFRFSPFGGHWNGPHLPTFGAVMAVSLLLILLLAFFKFFRAALGCFGVLLGLVVVVILLPALLPVVIIPFAILIPILIWAIPILLILWVLKLLID